MWENPYLNVGSDNLKTLKLHAYGIFFMMSNVDYLVWGREGKVSLIHLTRNRKEMRAKGRLEKHELGRLSKSNTVYVHTVDGKLPHKWSDPRLRELARGDITSRLAIPAGDKVAGWTTRVKMENRCGENQYRE